MLISEGHAHPLRGCRTGDDDARSVVDRDRKARAHHKLHVREAGIFPASGGAQPAQAVIALTSCLAERPQRRGAA